MNFEDARKQWLRERPDYVSFGLELEARIRDELKRIGLWADISSRAKTIDSLIRKLILKPQHTYESLGDKSGIRVVVRYKCELEPVVAAVRTLFDCSETDEKGEALRYDQVGYLSTHVDVRLSSQDPLASSFPPNRFHAELQVRTLAQHLWSEMSHDTFYKNDETLNPLPKAAKRRIYVLAGVVELADDEFNRVSVEMQAVPEVLLLKALERNFYKLTTRRADPEMSLDVIRHLAPLYGQSPGEIASHLEAFFSSHENVLRDVYEQADEDTDASAYLYQPEAIMIYDRLDADVVGTRRVWNQHYPERELERLANAFGISFD